MNLLLKHKWHYTSLAIIFLLFLISVQVRKDKLALPLSSEKEWVTAHTLITLKIWEDGGGPQNFGFKPIYTFEGKGNKGVGNLGGVMDEDGNLYYTSYPPFAFIFAYYGSSALGGPNLENLRTLGLITHFFCAILLYLIILKLRTNQKDEISIAGLLMAGLYLFSAGSLWMHSIMYFADTSVILFILLCIYLLIKLLKQDFQQNKIFYPTLGIAFFFAVYTEWLALFFAFFTVIILFAIYRRNKQKSHKFAIYTIGTAIILALSLTIIQYTSIAGIQELTNVSISKFQERAGISTDSITPVHNWSNPESFTLMESFANRNFAMVINLFGIACCLLVPIFALKKIRTRLHLTSEKKIIPLILFLAVLTHYLAFFNFNAIHNISNLKTGLLMILLIGIVVLLVEEIIDWKYKVGFSIIILMVTIPRTLVEIEKFDSFYTYESFNHEKHHSALLVNKFRDPDKYVFCNIYVTPEYIYKAQHNVFQLEDTSHTARFMDFFQTDKAQYYIHENNRPMYMLEYKKSGDEIRVVERIQFCTDFSQPKK